MTLSLTLTQPGSILISGAGEAQATSVGSDSSAVNCFASIPGLALAPSTGAVLGGPSPQVVVPVVQSGRFAGLSAGTYTITWSCGYSAIGSTTAAVENLTLDAWASQ